MSRNAEKDALMIAENRQRLLEAGFRLFAEQGIEKVTLNEVAREAGVGVATLFRHFPSKPELAVAISVWKWTDYIAGARRKYPPELLERLTAAEHLELYFDLFLDMYRSHRDMLRFNQFFNIYMRGEGGGQIEPYTRMIEGLTSGFHAVRRKAEWDGTVRTDVPETEMLSALLHIMLSAVTRYAVGLLYLPEGCDPERELALLKRALLREYLPRPASETM